MIIEYLKNDLELIDKLKTYQTEVLDVLTYNKYGLLDLIKTPNTYFKHIVSYEYFQRIVWDHLTYEKNADEVNKNVTKENVDNLVEESYQPIVDFLEKNHDLLLLCSSSQYSKYDGIAQKFNMFFNPTESSKEPDDNYIKKVKESYISIENDYLKLVYLEIYKKELNLIAKKIPDSFLAKGAREPFLWAITNLFDLVYKHFRFDKNSRIKEKQIAFDFYKIVTYQKLVSTYEFINHYQDFKKHLLLMHDLKENLFFVFKEDKVWEDKIHTMLKKDIMLFNNLKFKDLDNFNYTGCSDSNVMKTVDNFIYFPVKNKMKGDLSLEQQDLLYKIKNFNKPLSKVKVREKDTYEIKLCKADSKVFEASIYMELNTDAFLLSNNLITNTSRLSFGNLLEHNSESDDVVWNMSLKAMNSGSKILLKLSFSFGKMENYLKHKEKIENNVANGLCDFMETEKDYVYNSNRNIFQLIHNAIVILIRESLLEIKLEDTVENKLSVKKYKI